MKKLLVLSIFALSCLGASAQVNHSISGRVTDAKTSEPIIGAAVFIVGTTKGTSTDIDGTFTIPNVTRGRHTLSCGTLSYKSVERAIDLQRNLTDVNFSLEEDAVTMDEIVVSGQRRSNTETAMVGTVKASLQVTSGISAAQIAKSPDRNASEAVRRIPGITIIDDRFIIVRGLSQRYNNAWINGLPIPSTETDSRAFSFDLIPSSQIDNLLVYKSPAPEIPSDFSGGFVKIVTKGIPDENAIEIGYTTGFNVNTQFRSFRVNPGSSTDFLGFDTSKRPLGKDFPTHLRNITNPDALTQITQQSFNNDWRVRHITPLPDQRLSFLIARRLETKRGTIIGNITSINHSNTYKTVTGIKNARFGIYDGNDDHPVHINDYTDDQWTNESRLGALHNWSFQLNPNNRIEFKNLVNVLGRNRLTERAGIREASGVYYQRQTEMLYSSRLTYTGQLAGTHHFADLSTLEWDAGYSFASRNEPDRRIVNYIAGVGSAADIPNVTPHLNDPGGIARYFQSLHDHVVSASTDYILPFRLGNITPKFKTGLYGEYRMRSHTPREFVYRLDNLTGDQVSAFVNLPFQDMMQNDWLGADKVYIDETTKKTDAYSADMYHAAAYAAFEIPVGNLSIYAGARLESNTAKLTYDMTNMPDETMITHATTEDLHLLPSVNLTYRFNDKHQLRAAYGRSVNRPELRELSPTVYYDFDLFSEIIGNPELKTAVIDNADLRYEFYPTPGETVSIGAFYKHFKNPIEWTFVDMGGSWRYYYENAHQAVSWGIEVDIRKNLAFMGARNLALVLNAAWIQSDVVFPEGTLVVEPNRPMQGQSPYIVNGGLYYNSDKLGLDMALLYNVIGKRIVGLGKSSSPTPDPNTMIPNAYEMPRHCLDFSISKTIGRRVKLTASVKDILSEPIVYKQFPEFVKDGVTHKREQTTRKYNPGQSVSIGVTIKL